MSNKEKIEITVMESKFFKLKVSQSDGYDIYYFIENNLFIRNGSEGMEKADSEDNKSSWFREFLKKYNLKSENSPIIVFEKGENNQ